MAIPATSSPDDLSASFASAIAELGPFERAPKLAAAVSGGPDSMALAWLLIAWTKSLGGSLLVLSVDHGLRAGSAEDCAFVAAELADQPGVTVETLRIAHAPPGGGIQEWARDMRYGLLADRCRALGILHLCTGHTLDDQAETVAMREAHGSGPMGLAGMAAVKPLEGVRLLRPLLAHRREWLSRWLGANGLAWRDDPSNLADRFERVRHRRTIVERGEAEALAGRAEALGRSRNLQEREVARFLAASTRIHDSGFAEVATDRWLLADRGIRQSTLGALLLTIGGARYRAAPEAVSECLDAVEGKAAPATLGGCVVSKRAKRFVICRETGKSSEIREGSGAWAGRWDRRFSVAVDLSTDHWSLKALGSDGLGQLSRRHGMFMKRHWMPLAARKALPSLWLGEDLVSVPHLGWGQGLSARFEPAQSAAGYGFRVAVRGIRTI